MDHSISVPTILFHSSDLLTWIPLKVYNRFSGNECVSNNDSFLSASFHHDRTLLSGENFELDFKVFKGLNNNSRYTGESSKEEKF